MAKPQAPPPQFVMWRSIPEGQGTGWQRYWFGNELNASAVFNVRGLGLREPMFNSNVHRPAGTGDWLIMLFHQAARLNPSNANPSTEGPTLILWPPGVEQFYSWGKRANIEPHSWMHVEGTWVRQQVEENRLPTMTPIPFDAESILTEGISQLIQEMTEPDVPDSVILQNHFQTWARRTGRHLLTRDPERRIPDPLLSVRAYLEGHFTAIPSLDHLSQLAGMSRSYLCDQFREHFGTTISSYVIRKRMSVAQRLLYDPNLSPGEIARAIGYADIYQFSRQFRKSFGLSPTAFRKQQLNGKPRRE